MNGETADAAAARLYTAFAGQDGAALLAALTPDFRGVVAAGMPFGVGGVHHGAERMLNAVWGVVARHLDVAPVPEEYLVAGPGRVVVAGRYRGSVRATGAPLDAAFTHLLRIADGRVAELVQVTDTACWHAALAAGTAG